ncbi:MAG: ethanolamine utilization protein EutH [Firmicutes bacterium]|nr:ethanolamine utilization protein EutH [Bacillota bacterium]
MLITQIITYIVAAFAAAGAVDRIIGNRFGLGERFAQAFHTMGPLALSMAGMLVIAPVIADLIGPVMTPVFYRIGSDPAVFAGMFMGTDMGAAPLAEALAQDPRSAALSGFVISSMMGATVVFHIPVAMEIAGESKALLARGMIAGLITIPPGCFLGGMAAGLPAGLVLRDLLPVTVVALLLAVGMVKFREAMVRGFIWLGMFIQAVCIFGLLLGILQSLAGITLIRGIAPISDAFGVVATVAVFLAGAFPLMHVLTKLLRRPLRAAGNRIGINEVSAIGPLLTVVNSIPMLETMKDMDDRGKVINAAFCVTGAFMFGDFFGYVAAANAAMLVPMILAKLSSGIAAMLLAFLMTRYPASPRKPAPDIP